MTHEYRRASDATLAFFRNDVERSAEKLESIMVSRVSMGEILARLDSAEATAEAATWAEVAATEVRRRTGRERDEGLRKLAGIATLAAKYRAHAEVRWPGSVIAEQIDYWLADDHPRQSDCCYGCSEPNRCGCPTSAEASSDV